MYLKNLLILVLTIWTTFDCSARKISVSNQQGKTDLKYIIENAKTFDTIIIKKGHYFCNNITIKKTLTILGEGMPVIDGGLKGEVFTIQADHIRIKGLKIQNTGSSDLKELAGIKLYNSNYCSIENNEFYNTYFGIYISNSTYCKVTGNNIQGTATVETSSGNGIHLWKSSHCLITNNKIEHHRDGIYFEFVTKTNITNNNSTKNLRYGLHFMFSDGNSYEYNTFTNNGAGVAVMYTRNIKMMHNVFENNWGDAAYGILLKDISHSTISNNVFLKNTVGIYMEGSGHLMINNNQFENNGWALKIMANCTEDTLIKNNFTGNSFDVSTNGTSNENIYSENYWDNYKGYDLNRDNIGDVPYRPVSLFSLIVEEIPTSIILLRSFMVDILNQAEKMVPVFIPESIIDNKPRMTMYDY